MIVKLSGQAIEWLKKKGDLIWTDESGSMKINVIRALSTARGDDDTDKIAREISMALEFVPAKIWYTTVVKS